MADALSATLLPLSQTGIPLTSLGRWDLLWLGWIFFITSHLIRETGKGLAKPQGISKLVGTVRHSKLWGKMLWIFPH